MNLLTPKNFDVAIVGAGPAGLSGALLLARCRRSVLIIDSGKPRNAVSQAIHGYLSRDGMDPTEFLSVCRDELLRYPSICFKKAKVTDIKRGRFFSLLLEKEKIVARKILLATGTEDEVPPIQGFAKLFGHGVYLCPYCDGWEVKDQPIAIYGKNERGPEFALTMQHWSRDIVLLTDGPLPPEQKKELGKSRIRVIEKTIGRLEGHGWLDSVVFTDGEKLKRKALFFNMPKSQKSSLAAKLKCKFTRSGGIRTDRMQFTGVAGVYAAGDACDGFKMAIIAAAQGATAALAMNSDLLGGK